MAATLECARAGRDHRRVGRRAARGVRRVPRADRVSPHRSASPPRGHRSPRCARRSPHRRGARRPAAPAGRQARPRRALQRRRADRRPGPRRRVRGGLPGHPPHPRADRRGGGRRGRALRRPVDPVRLARCSWSPRCCDGLRAAGAEDIPVIVGGIIPDGRRARPAGRRAWPPSSPRRTSTSPASWPRRRRDPPSQQARPPGGRAAHPRPSHVQQVATACRAPTDRLRPRRSCLAVPGSNPRFLEKAQGLPADQVFLDLEDACAPLAKEGARHTIVAALNEGGWSGKTRVVRVNDWTTHWTYRDVIEVVEGAGAEPRLHHAAEGAERRAGRGARPAAHPDREDDGLRGRPDRHRGADRERPGPDQRRRDRRRLAAASRRSSSARPTSWRRST